MQRGEGQRARSQQRSLKLKYLLLAPEIPGLPFKRSAPEYHPIVRVVCFRPSEDLTSSVTALSLGVSTGCSILTYTLPLITAGRFLETIEDLGSACHYPEL